MLHILKKIVTKLGGVDTSEKNHKDTTTENLIIKVDGEKIATIENGGIWVEFQELGGFELMETIVVGQKDLKTNEGCSIVFETNNGEITLKSDMHEIESEFSNVSNRWITRISFDVNEADKQPIFDRTAHTIRIDSKKNSESFEAVQ